MTEEAVIRDVPYFHGGLPLPAPRADGVDVEFWAAAREHRLVVQRCAACGEAQFPPEVICRSCQSKAVEWRDIEPRGTLTSSVRVWHPTHPALEREVPYLVGVVELAAGARMIGNILGDARRTDLTIGMAMSAVFEDHDDADVTLIQWRPV
jgi:uncharacterized OB-fold protein